MGFMDLLYEEAERRNSKQEETCPRCYNCDEPIYDDVAYLVEGHLYCEDCIDSAKVWIESE